MDQQNFLIGMQRGGRHGHRADRRSRPSGQRTRRQVLRPSERDVARDHEQGAARAEARLLERKDVGARQRADGRR
jgi:hypothetical protein